jgi:hypothetical protein
MIMSDQNPQSAETAPMHPNELGHYVCVMNCLHSPQVTIRADGVWVKRGLQLASAHRDCYEASQDPDSGATAAPGDIPAHPGPDTRLQVGDKVWHWSHPDPARPGTVVEIEPDEYSFDDPTFHVVWDTDDDGNPAGPAIPYRYYHYLKKAGKHERS